MFGSLNDDPKRFNCLTTKVDFERQYYWILTSLSLSLSQLHFCMDNLQVQVIYKVLYGYYISIKHRTCLLTTEHRFPSHWTR